MHALLDKISNNILWMALQNHIVIGQHLSLACFWGAKESSWFSLNFRMEYITGSQVHIHLVSWWNIIITYVMNSLIKKQTVFFVEKNHRKKNISILHCDATYMYLISDRCTVWLGFVRSRRLRTMSSLPKVQCLERPRTALTEHYGFIFGPEYPWQVFDLYVHFVWKSRYDNN